MLLTYHSACSVEQVRNEDCAGGNLRDVECVLNGKQTSQIVPETHMQALAVLLKNIRMPDRRLRILLQ
jgi:hypothetical protein